MNEFSLLFNTELKLIKNNLARIITTPKVIISYIAVLIFMSWGIISNFKHSAELPISIDNLALYLGAATFALFTVLYYVSTKQNSVVFRISEINLLFTAPVDPKKILFFNLVRKIPPAFLSSALMLVFAIPFTKRHFDPSHTELIFFFLGITMIFLILEPLSFFFFAIGTRLNKSTLSHSFAKLAIVSISALVLISASLSIYRNGLSFESLLLGVNANYLDWIPIIGWGRHLILSVAHGVSTQTVVTLVAMISTYIILIIATYFLGNGYYEDIISTSEQSEKIIADAKEGVYDFIPTLSFTRQKEIHIRSIGSYSFAFDWKRRLLLRKKRYK